MADEDRRITAGKALVADEPDERKREIVQGLLDYGQSRLTINVGIISENAELRKQARQPAPDVDLTAVSTADLLAEVARRMEAR